MAKQKKGGPDFPITLFVKREDDGDDHYFLSVEDVGSLAEQGESVPVAIYKYVGSKILTIKALLN